MQISLVVAMAKNHVIGYQGTMPWHLPAELAYFKKNTLNKTIIMGRKTFESIGKALSQRRNIVISHQSDLQIPGCEIFASIAAALATVNPNEEAMIIGGGSLFQQTFPIANKLYITLIEADLPGDTFFPEWDSQEWKVISEEYHPISEKNIYPFRTLVLERLK